MTWGQGWDWTIEGEEGMLGKLRREIGSMKRDNRFLAAIAVLCFLSGLLFSREDGHDMTVAGYFFVVALMAVCNIILFSAHRPREERRLALLCSVMGLFFLGALKYVYYVRGNAGQEERTLIVSTLFLLAILAAWGVFCVWREGGATENIVLLLIFGGFLLRLFYVAATQGHLIQNDVGTLEMENTGHLGYVRALLTTGKLPGGNPMEQLQFYQPPLHYLVSTLTLKLYAFLGVEASGWDEVLQMLPVFYTTAMLVVLNKIGVQMKCPLSGRVLAVGLAAYFPYSIYMGGALNNDPLMILLVLLCLYLTLKWYEKPTLKGILAMAVCIGCAMMTKVSAALISPAMAAVMLWRAWRDRAEWRRYLRQFVCFGLVAFPLGLWHSVYYRIKYGMPFGFVYRITEDTEQFLGWNLGWHRFRGWSEALDHMYVAFGWDGETPETNIPVSLVKYGVFNELHSFGSNRVIHTVSQGVFWGTMALAALIVVFFVVWLFMGRYGFVEKAALGLGIAVITGGYVSFCYEYPYVCSMNIRYVMAAVYLGMLVLGCAVSSLLEGLGQRNRRLGRAGSVAVGGIAAAYMICCILLLYNLELMLF